MDKIIKLTPSVEHFKKYSEHQDEYIKFHPEMSYAQAAELIHNTILSLGS